MKLIVCLEGQIAGELGGAGSRASLVYSKGWLQESGACPLAQALPLGPTEFNGRTLLDFRWGVLPDNARTLDAWAGWFHVSARNPLALLSHVGEDCAGAVQFV